MIRMGLILGLFDFFIIIVVGFFLDYFFQVERKKQCYRRSIKVLLSVLLYIKNILL